MVNSESSPSPYMNIQKNNNDGLEEEENGMEYANEYSDKMGEEYLNLPAGGQ